MTKKTMTKNDVPGEEPAAAIPSHAIPHVVRAICGSAWAIVPEKLDEILAFVNARAQGTLLDAAEIAAAIGEKNGTREPGQQGGVAVLPLFGTLFYRMGGVEAISGGTSVQGFSAAFREALRRGDVSAILIDVDSGGGSVEGVSELSRLVFEARGIKPIVAVANTWAGSAAYYVASAAGELAVTPSGEVGSIGIVQVHTDQSGADGHWGLKRTVIRAGRYKAEMHPYGPLSEDALAGAQASVNDHYAQFVEAVARNRGTTAEAVAGGFGEGRMVRATAAVAMGMADRAATFDAVLQELLQGTHKLQKRKSAAGVGGGHPAGSMSGTAGKEILMDLSQLTMEALKAGRPDLAAELKGEGAAELGEKLAKTAAAPVDLEPVKAAAAISAERERCTAIAIAAHEHGLAAMAGELIAKGQPVSDCLVSIKDAKLKLLEKQTPAGAGPNAGEESKKLDPKKPDEHLELAKAYQRENKCSLRAALHATAAVRT